MNRNRAIRGEITAECPDRLHTAPFGNWGVTSNFGTIRDGHQFDGWCNNTRVCDNNNNCKNVCRDGWFEWNSCTNHPDFKAPNCSLYNAANCTEQVTTTGPNVHGTRMVEVKVRCPIDLNNDGVADGGGCADVKSLNNGRNFMSLYELDPITGNDLVQTLYFPDTPVNLNCTPAGCPTAGSSWVGPTSYDSPVTPAKVFTEMAMVVNSGTFVDSGKVCRVLVSLASAVSSASFRPEIAPGSIVTLFGSNFTDANPAPDAARLFVTDAGGTRREAKVLYVSPKQINFVVPAASPTGASELAVESKDGGLRAIANLTVLPLAPAVFSTDGTGTGTAAGLVYQRNGAAPTALVGTTAEPIRVLGAETVVALFGTGIRRAAAGTVQATIAGIPMDVLFAGPQGQYDGLDQVNIRLSPVLSGLGQVQVVVFAEGRAANSVTIRIQ
ncbi:MAG: hypothetical protein U0Q16_19340 [Bryobacteraceae bacterium]